MHALSQDARRLLDQLERDRRYEVTDLRALVSDASAERLHEVMHELWVNRQVERVASSGWRRLRSAPDHRGALDAQLDTHRVVHGGEARAVKPEDLFDHDRFQDFFRPPGS
jgi:hypothetical protein